MKKIASWVMATKLKRGFLFIPIGLGSGLLIQIAYSIFLISIGVTKVHFFELIADDLTENNLGSIFREKLHFFLFTFIGNFMRATATSGFMSYIAPNLFLKLFPVLLILIMHIASIIFLIVNHNYNGEILISIAWIIGLFLGFIAYNNHPIIMNIKEQD